MAVVSAGVGSVAARAVAVVLALLAAGAGVEDDPEVAEVAEVERGVDQDSNAAHLMAPEGAIFLKTGAWMPLPV